MLEQILAYISTVDTTWIYIILFFFAFIENVFPPSPSDVVVVVGASLIASTSMGFLPVLILTSFGSSLGFILMYYVGFYFSEHVLRTGKLKFISQESLSKTDIWFTKYGYKLILANRFLPGTRSVISFFSGVYELDVKRTFVLASVSAFLWNTIIVFAGMELGSNVDLIDYYLTTYSNIAIVITIIVVLVFVLKYFYTKSKKTN